MFTIRHAADSDQQAIKDIIVDAFTHSELGYNGEADLVQSLHDNCDALLSLVAVEQEVVVGHILFSPVTFQSSETSHPTQAIACGMGLAPMAIRPTHQRRGIGSDLIQTAFVELQKQNCSCIVVLGHPEYYQRFGFAPATEYGVRHGFDGIPQDVFFIKPLGGFDLMPLDGSTAIFRREFGEQSTQ